MQMAAGRIAPDLLIIHRSQQNFPCHSARTWYKCQTGGGMSDLDLTLLHAALSGIPPDRSSLLPALHAAQKIYGYIPELAAAEISARLGVPLAEVHGVIDFYALFYREPTAR